MNKLAYLVAFLFLVVINSAFSQQHFCGTDHHHRQLVEQYPHLQKEYEKFNAQLAMLQKDDDYDSQTVYVIPIVFHILHQDGTENISDAQVFDQVAVLNRDYRKLNADTADIIPAFQAIASDARIEFRLANRDPWGNCTNGIDRIRTHETNFGRGQSKLNQWDRSKYLNVWVVRTIESGAAGYAHYPTDVAELESYWRDGIVILHGHIGRIGTGSEGNSRSLTHEIGHWLSLAHPWGSNNDAGAGGCFNDDDGVDDTPFTKGFTFCPQTPEQAMLCTPGVPENYQNYMDYSYCSNMFTADQVKRMRLVLKNIAFRANLITAENHLATGINLESPLTCAPIVDIRVNSRLACVGETVEFFDASSNGVVSSYLWEFGDDASPSTSADANPNVIFMSPGAKTIKLTVGNSAGTRTAVFERYIDVQPDVPTTYSWYHTFDMQTAEQFSELTYLNNLNISDTLPFFSHDQKGHGNKGSVRLNLFKNVTLDVTTSLPSTQESRYWLNLDGFQHAIVTPGFNLTNLSPVYFSFSYSYATRSPLPDFAPENIRVYYSRNCGKTWTTLGTTTQSTIDISSGLSSGGMSTYSPYVPTSINDWNIYSRPFNVTSNDLNTRFKIEFTPSMLSNDLYIDNISISSEIPTPPPFDPNEVPNIDAGIDDFTLAHQLTMSPNPVMSGNQLAISYRAGSDPMTFTLRDLNGSILSSVERLETNQPVLFSLDIDRNLPAAYYLLEIRSAIGVSVKKVAVVR